ncbi:MAG: D-alanine--D-alanine ligase [Thermoflexales bacterium]|nr:D-alanine--D-alanine ligase [Thermoflexales bacterium]
MAKRKLRIGVIFGGKSGEHEVSVSSAQSVMRAIDPARYEVVPIGITKEGRWLTHGDPLAALTSRQVTMASLLSGATIIDAAGGSDLKGEQLSLDLEITDAEMGNQSLISRTRDLIPGTREAGIPNVDVIFPVLHGPYGEDGTLQGLLELADIPYVGAGVMASAVGMDKAVMKDVFVAHGLPVAPYLTITRQSWERDPVTAMEAIEQKIGWPCFVKPANLGSSVGISKAHNIPELDEALAEAAQYDRKLLVEMAVPQAREIECSVLGNDDPIASLPGEIVPSREFYDYAAKYLDSGENASQLLIPAPIADELAAQVRGLSIKAYTAIDCAGMARADFLLDGQAGTLYINELNTIPGFTQISMYTKLWEASGIPYAELIDRLVELALERYTDKRRSRTTYVV